MCVCVCEGHRRPVLSLCCVGRWRLACFYSLCVSPCLFLFPLILIALCHQPKLSSLRSARRLVVFTSYPSTVRPPAVPVSWEQRAWPAPSGSLQPRLPASWPLLSVWGWLAGRTRDGWAGLLPCMLLLLESLMHCVSACPLSQALLLEWLHTHGARHTTVPHRTAPSFAPTPG